MKRYVVLLMVFVAVLAISLYMFHNSDEAKAGRRVVQQLQPLLDEFHPDSIHYHTASIREAYEFLQTPGIRKDANTAFALKTLQEIHDLIEDDWAELSEATLKRLHTNIDMRTKNLLDSCSSEESKQEVHRLMELERQEFDASGHAWEQRITAVRKVRYCKRWALYNYEISKFHRDNLTRHLHESTCRICEPDCRY